MTQPPSSDDPRPDPFGGLPPREDDDAAAQDGGTPASGSDDHEPTRVYGAPGPQGWGAPSAPQQPPYGQQPTYGQQPYGQAPYGQQPYPVYYAPPPGWRPQPASHPSATTALVLGIIALVGGMVCYLPIFLAPFAWIKGSSALKAIRDEPDHYGGRTEALTGKILGIIGTVLLALGLALVAILITVAIVNPEFFESDPSY